MTKTFTRHIPIPPVHPTLTFTLYLVGGIIRDRLLGIRSKDADFSVVASSTQFDVDVTYNAMLAWLHHTHGVEFYELKPENGTARGFFPHDHEQWPGMACDFVLARKDGPYSDGRRPDYVMTGTFEDDINRRDLTINAIAQDMDGRLIDLHGGLADLQNRLLRFVGDPADRIREDALRVLRVLRFHVTKGFTMHPATVDALFAPPTAARVALLASERRADELALMFKHDTLATLDLLEQLPRPLRDAMFAGACRLTTTLKH